MKLANTALLTLPSLVLANPVITNHAFLYERAAATPTVPETTPTGSACKGATSTATVSPAQLAAAVAPCVGVQPAGTNFTRNDVVEGMRLYLMCLDYT